MQPFSAEAKRVFSILRSSFNEHQSDIFFYQRFKVNKGEGWVRQLLAVSDLPIVKKINLSFLKYERDNNVSPNPAKSSNLPESNVVTPTRVILYNESSASSSQV